MLSLRRIPLFAVALAAFAGAVLADDKPCMLKEREIALKGDGSWDYVTIDSAAERLYVAHATRIDVIDLKKNEKIGEVEGVEGAHGTAIVSQQKRGFSTAGKKTKLVVFDPGPLKVTKEVA